jgi:hypothetical protein
VAAARLADGRHLAARVVLQPRHGLATAREMAGVRGTLRHRQRQESDESSPVEVLDAEQLAAYQEADWAQLLQRCRVSH